MMKCFRSILFALIAVTPMLGVEQGIASDVYLRITSSSTSEPMGLTYPSNISGNVGKEMSITPERAQSPPGERTFTLRDGSLPPGLELDQETGVIGGYPTADGSYPDIVIGLSVNRESVFSPPISITTTYAAVVATVNSGVNIVARDYFANDDWTSPAAKRLVVSSGATIGSDTSATPALSTGTSWGGALTIENNGSIQGAGGLPNGGAGGTAFRADKSGVALINTGTIWAGGGGGGYGGTGGAASYSEVSTVTEGPYYNGSYKIDLTRGVNAWIWAGSLINSTPGSVSSFVSGPYTYKQGSLAASTEYYISRTFQSTKTVPVAGSAGGAGGHGQGFDSAAVSGSQASPAAAHSSRGGAGGDGGAWGLGGAAGSAGVAGNVGAGLAGSSGGRAGLAIENPDWVSVTDTGQVLGL